MNGPCGRVGRICRVGGHVSLDRAGSSKAVPQFIPCVSLRRRGRGICRRVRRRVSVYNCRGAVAATMYPGPNPYGLFVVLSTGTVHVAVGDLFFRRVANIGDLYGKIQFHTGKWMVTVDCDIVSLDCDDRYDQRLPLG